MTGIKDFCFEKLVVCTILFTGVIEMLHIKFLVCLWIKEELKASSSILYQGLLKLSSSILLTCFFWSQNIFF